MPARRGKRRRAPGAREPLGVDDEDGESAPHLQGGRFAMARPQPGHGELSGGSLSGDREARAPRDDRPGEDVLRRRRVVHARPRLQTDRRHPAQRELRRVGVAGNGGEGGSGHRGAEEPPGFERGFRVGYGGFPRSKHTGERRRETLFILCFSPSPVCFFVTPRLPPYNRGTCGRPTSRTPTTITASWTVSGRARRTPTSPNTSG